MGRQRLIWAGAAREQQNTPESPLVEPCSGPIPSSTSPSSVQVRASHWAFYSQGKVQQEQWAERGRGLTGKPLLGIALTRQPLGVEGVLHSRSNCGLSLSGVSLDIILEPDTQTLTVPVGETATFHCRVTGADLKNYQMSWYKKHEDNSLTLVYRLSNNSNDHLRSNIKGKIDVLNSQYILDIQKTTTKDVGTYYCGSDIHSAALLLLTASESPGSDGGGRSN